MEGRPSHTLSGTPVVVAHHLCPYQMPKEIASDLVKLSLFDTILYIDDSGSMAFEQGTTVIGPFDGTVVDAYYVLPSKVESV